MQAKYIGMLLVPFLFISCSSKKNVEKDLEFNKKPVTQVPKQDPIVRKNKGSLYSMQGASLFADKKDLQVGDIIQVVISEALDSSSNNKREMTTNRSTSLGGGLATPKTGVTLGGTTASLANRFNAAVGVDIGTGSSSADKGEAKSSFSESFDTTVSAIINEVYQNGNYMIKGSKQILIEGQKQEIILTGIIRPYDISAENSINSNQIANLKLLYNKDGEEADVMETPWGTKLLRKIWPF